MVSCAGQRRGGFPFDSGAPPAYTLDLDGGSFAGLLVNLGARRSRAACTGLGRHDRGRRDFSPIADRMDGPGRAADSCKPERKNRPAMLVYPAVDIAKGRCVRLLQGRPEDEKVYYRSPAEAALHWQQLGAGVLHVVDLDGALSDSRNAGAVADILARCSMRVQVAGGLRSRDTVRRVLEAGAVRAVVGTRAAREPGWAVELCRELPDRIVIAVDAREGRVALEGWRETTEMAPVELARLAAEGRPAAFLYTDVARDGMLSRPHFEGVRQLLAAVDVPVIASGGVSSVEDIRRLGECGADAVIVGKALYEGVIELPEALEAAADYTSRLDAAPGAESR